MNKKGFTLVELLAVIVVLAVVLVIATVSVNGILDKSREKAAVATANSIIRASSVYSFDNDYYESMSVLDSRLSYDGNKPTSGTVQTNEDGDTRIAILANGWCATKGYNDIEVIATKTNTCNMP